MNINKKYIIIFGTLILLLVFIIVAITYYKEKEEQIPISTSIPIPEEEMYLIWCYESGITYDCSDRSFFQPREPVSISVNLKQFDNIIFDPYFLCYYSDLSNRNGELGKQCLSIASLGELRLEKGITVPQYKAVFSLLTISIYPDDSFKEADEYVILDLVGRLKDFTGTLNY